MKTGFESLGIRTACENDSVFDYPFAHIALPGVLKVASNSSIFTPTKSRDWYHGMRVKDLGIRPAS
jgi:hypothetical protein